LNKEEIKALRKKLGLTQNDMAKRLDIMPSCVSRWERGESRPSRAMLKKLNRLEKRSAK